MKDELRELENIMSIAISKLEAIKGSKIDIENYSIQFYIGGKMIVDRSNITLSEAKNIAVNYLDEFKGALEKYKYNDMYNPELAIWRAEGQSTYQHKIMHLDTDCFIEDGRFYLKQQIDESFINQL